MDGPFRALHFDEGQDKDAHGRHLGSDHEVLTVQELNADPAAWVTTDCVRCSEVGDLLPGTNRGLARLVAVALNELHASRSTAEWAALLRDVERGEPPPPPRELARCLACEELIADGEWITGAGSYHAACAPLPARPPPTPRPPWRWVVPSYWPEGPLAQPIQRHVARAGEYRACCGLKPTKRVGPSRWREDTSAEVCPGCQPFAHRVAATTPGTPQESPCPNPSVPPSPSLSSPTS